MPMAARGQRAPSTRLGGGEGGAALRRGAPVVAVAVVDEVAGTGACGARAGRTGEERAVDPRPAFAGRRIGPRRAGVTHIAGQESNDASRRPRETGMSFAITRKLLTAAFLVVVALWFAALPLLMILSDLASR